MARTMTPKRVSELKFKGKKPRTRWFSQVLQGVKEEAGKKPYREDVERREWRRFVH
jgi:hypothetical protein